MKAVSVRAPYAQLIILGHLDVLNRGGQIKQLTEAIDPGDTLAVHVGQRPNREAPAEDWQLLEFAPADIVEARGAILGTITVGEPHGSKACADVDDLNRLHFCSTSADPGKIHLPILEAQPFDTPILGIDGRLGIWEWKDYADRDTLADYKTILDHLNSNGGSQTWKQIGATLARSMQVQIVHLKRLCRELDFDIGAVHMNEDGVTLTRSGDLYVAGEANLGEE